VAEQFITRSPKQTYCEFKGQASYLNVQVGDRVASDAAWYYPAPSSRYAAIAGFVAFYPQKMDECTVDGVRVQAQEGEFYGGWITPEIVGPFKGGAGTRGW